MDPIFSTANVIVGVATIVAVVLCAWLHYECLKIANHFLSHRSRFKRRWILFLVLGLMIVHIIDVWIFGLAYLFLDSVPSLGYISGLQDFDVRGYIYFSAMVYSTVGFGDMVPVGAIRLLCGMQAITGLLLIGWSASFTYLQMSRHWRDS